MKKCVWKKNYSESRYWLKYWFKKKLLFLVRSYSFNLVLLYIFSKGNQDPLSGSIHRIHREPVLYRSNCTVYTRYQQTNTIKLSGSKQQLGILVSVKNGSTKPTE